MQGAKSESSKIAEPELIWKEHLTGVVREDGSSYSMPLGILLGNAEGFRWLAKYFMERADAAERLERYYARNANMVCVGDPDDHEHLSMTEAPFNAALSDESELRVGHLVECNRDETIGKYEITATKEGMMERWQRILARAAQQDSE